MVQEKIKIFSTFFLAGILLISGIAHSRSQSEEKIKFINPEEGIYIVSIDTDYFTKNSDIYTTDFLETVEEVGKKTNAKIAINAGFFDPKNGKTVSYLIKNDKIILNPEENERLTDSEELKPYLNKIFNRSEFRVLSCVAPGGKFFNFCKITSHNEPVFPECKIIYSIQAGPALVPKFDPEKEFFILKKDGKVVRQSAGTLNKQARSAVGIKKDRILLVFAGNENPMTLQELADFMKKLGAEEAMAFDGGSSASLYSNLPGTKVVFTSAKDNSARSVKTILTVK